jgi:hypothetical protein
MAQLFGKSANTLARIAIVGSAGGGALFSLVAWAVYHSPWRSRVGVKVEQPIPFSHKHHAGELGIDCRYCHTSVETDADAGLPATATCMHCHAIIWRDAPMLAPVRESLAQTQPLAWRRVYKLPDYVYFNHAMHVQHGVACGTCHGTIEEMPLTARAEDLTMRWCIDCHERQTDAERLRDCDTCHR